MQARDLNTELSPVPGFGQGQVAHVEVQVELFIIHPVGVVYVGRRPLDFLAEYRRGI